MGLPEFVTLRQMPDGHLSSHYNLTLGKTYAVRGEMGSCVVIDSDDPGETVSVHWSRFVAPTDV